MTPNAAKPIHDWPSANQGFYDSFRQWLRQGGYGDSALKLYSIAARLALSLVDKPYWAISDNDLDRVWTYVATRYENEGTRATYRKGLAKLVEYWHQRCHHEPPPKPVNWDHYLGSLPEWLAQDVRTYVAHRRRTWVPERRHRATLEILSHLSRSLRWMTNHAQLADIGDVAPALWFDYLDFRLAKGIKPATVNRELAEMQDFLQFFGDAGHPVCQRMMRLKPLPVGDRLPRNVPVDQLQRLMEEIETDATAANAGIRRMGIMDRAWFSLMVYSGLRMGEIRRLRLSDLDLEGRRVRIEQSKGLKDRVIPICQPAAEALRAYLEVRGPAPADHVFIYRHSLLGSTYCNHRLVTYGRRCGVRITCHRLRHSCATLLLNAGAPILAVQAILGHKKIETTLLYARLYDGTVAADYYRAMAQIERRIGLRDGGPAPDLGQLLALVDSLSSGTLNNAQRETVQALRDGILALVDLEAKMI
jgi:integrase